MLSPRKPGKPLAHAKKTGKNNRVSFARRIILTRQEQQNRIWQQSLVADGWEVLDLPLLRFAALEVPTEMDTASFDWILFTSPQGVAAFVAAGLKTGQAGLGALGAGTSAALKLADLPDDLDFNGLDGTELARSFSKQITPPATVLLPGAAKRMEDPGATLKEAGFEVQELPIYKTLPVPPDQLAAEFKANDVVFFCSPSTVRAFTAAFTERPDCVAIGATTAAVCREQNFPTRVAMAPQSGNPGGRTFPLHAGVARAYTSPRWLRARRLPQRGLVHRRRPPGGIRPLGGLRRVLAH